MAQPKHAKNVQKTCKKRANVRKTTCKRPANDLQKRERLSTAFPFPSSTSKTKLLNNP